MCEDAREGQDGAQVLRLLNAVHGAPCACCAVSCSGPGRVVAPESCSHPGNTVCYRGGIRYPEVFYSLAVSIAGHVADGLFGTTTDQATYGGCYGGE